MKTNLPLAAILVILLTWGATSGFAETSAGDEHSPLQFTWTIASPPPLVFGVIPYATDMALAAEFAPLSTYLGHHLKCGVKLVVAPSYKSLAGLLDSGEVEVARFSAVSFETFNRADRWEVLCRPMVSGKVFSRGIFIALASGPIQTLEDLRGKRFAFVDPSSGSGFVKPRELLKAQGINPVSFFGHVSFSGNHSASLNGLRGGEYDGAVVFENALAQRNGEVGNPTEEFRQLARTDWILTDPIVVRKEMPAERKKALLDLFVHMRERDLGASASAELKRLRDYDGFIAEGEIKTLTPPQP